MKTKKKKKTDQMVKKFKKACRIAFYIGFIVLFFYVVINRVQDIKGIEFFFTTWK